MRQAQVVDAQLSDRRAIPQPALLGLYGVAIVASISTWFLAIRAPLWLDETVSFFIIKGRFTEIFARQGWPAVPAYPWLLWVWAWAFGTGELALRMSSLLATLAAVGLLYAAARELFDWEIAASAAVLFCLHPVVVPEAIDIRPYPFAMLAINASIFLLVRLRKNPAHWIAALFGFSSACIVYFQFLFIVIVPVLAFCFVALKAADGKRLWRQFAIACAVFALAMLPVLPGLNYLLHTRADHVFAPVPMVWELAQVLVQVRPAMVIVVVLVLAAILHRLDLHSNMDLWRTFVCLSLGLVPILILYGISTHTSTRIFVFRYRLIGVPGAVLLWAWVLRRVNSRALRLAFCLGVVVLSSYHLYRSPFAGAHFYSWKYALAAAQTSATTDQAPVLICSDLPESNHATLPTGDAVKDNILFPSLSYYPLSVPVIGMPRALDEQALRVGSQFLQDAVARHSRFLALAYFPSYDTLDWLQQKSASAYSVRELGLFDGIKVMEFTPRERLGNGR